MTWERIFVRVQAAVALLILLTGMVWGPRELLKVLLQAGMPQAGEVVPRQIPYRGYLEQNGVPLSNPSIPMRFRLFGIDGGVLHEETVSSVPVLNGQFSVDLADGLAVDAGIWRENFLELEVAVGSPAVPLQGRQRILSLPFAQHAAFSDSATASTFASQAAYAADAGHAGRADSATLLTGRRVVSFGGNQFSVGGLMCGSTAPTTGNMGGIRGAKLLCETACANSPSAHMCTAEEFFMMKNLNYPLPSADIYWIAGNFRAAYGGTYGFTDCEGWTNSTAPGAPGYYGTTMQYAYLYVDGCNSSHPVLCCD